MSAEPVSLFGPLLKRYRVAAGLTQEALAERAGLSVRAVSDLERGLKRTPRRDTLDLLAEALALSPHKRTLFVGAARPEVDLALMDRASPTALRSNVPASLDPLLGREQETLAAVGLLRRADMRLLTLTGPGGVGKTRLALQVADDAQGLFDDGVQVVALAMLRDPDLVLPAIARAVDIALQVGQPPLDQLCAGLRARHLLLVLDNLEQVIGVAADLAMLLARCPHLKLLVTSREPLRVRGEQEMAVAPLSPDAAAELFVTRARAVRPDMPLTAETLPAVAAICQRLDRLPLAIELAAVCVRVWPPQALLERLERRLPLLTMGARDLPERQRTMRDAIAWSYDLLTPDEQALFRRLAVFSGGCALEAVEALYAWLGPAEDEAALEGLLGLVEKSLLRVETLPDGASRFAMLETLGEYAQERLAETAEAEALRRWHADHYARFVEEMASPGPDQDARDARLEQDVANARAVLEWARARGEVALGLRVAVALARFWYMRGFADEGDRWLRELLALDATAGERAASPEVCVMALYGASRFALDQRDYARAEATASEGLALARRAGNAGGAGNMLAILGHVAEARGDLANASVLFESSLAECRAAGDEGGAARALSSLGNLARKQGDYARAAAYVRETLDYARGAGMSWGIANGLTSLGHIACEQGDYARAAACYREGLTIYTTMDNKAAVAWCLEGVAVVAAAAGQHERVAWLSGLVDALRDAVRALPAPEWPPYARAVAAGRAALGDAAFRVAWARGGESPLHAAAASALADAQ